ncbi:hypothetical protein [Companilactobacillus hulinensis]|uniref:hypothetical protein n=1 Tax=Companilactobacillus hulinensis TaxID=2486007 RepID=UPI000F78F04F|nr:hypothetical protein [Companilactobacillus hulinensis]
MRRTMRILLSLFAIMLGLVLTIETYNVEAATTQSNLITAKINTPTIDNNNEKAQVDFQLSNKGSQLILLSPDYENLNIDYLQKELGNSNVVEDKNDNYVIVNLKNQMNSKYSGSFNVEMKQANSDNLVIRDMNNDDLFVKNLTQIDSNNEIKTTNVDVSNKPVLKINNLGTTDSSVKTGTSYEVTGSWYDYDSQNVQLYYGLDDSNSDNAKKLVNYTQSQKDSNNFVAHQIDEKINLNGQTGVHTIYFWIKDAEGHWSDVSSSDINISSSTTVVAVKSRMMMARSLTASSTISTSGYKVSALLVNGSTATANTTTADNPYMSKSSSFKLNFNVVTPKYPDDFVAVYYSTDEQSQQYNSALGSGMSHEMYNPVNIDTSEYTDNTLHHVTVVIRRIQDQANLKPDPDGPILASDTFYFRTGYSLAVEPPTNIDFGSYMPGSSSSTLLNANLDGSKLTVVDGRLTDTKQKLQLVTNNLQNENGTKLNGSIYWGNTPYQYGTPIDIKTIDSPSSDNSIKTYDLSSLLEQNLKMKLDPSNLSAGDYKANNSLGNVWTWQFVSSV